MTDHHIKTMDTLFAECKTIAVVGMSAKPDRPSHEVACYMQNCGYRIVPVNPAYAGTYILQERCFATLLQAAEALSEEGVRIDLVNCFRQAEHIVPIVEDAITIGARYVWMQLNIVNHEAAQKAKHAGMIVIMNRCIKIDHMQRHPD